MMKDKLVNFTFLFSYAWKNCRQCCIIFALKAVFKAVLPLIDIAGLGLVVNALSNGESEAEVIRLIIIFVSFTLAVNLISEFLTLLSNNASRKESDAVQLEYIYNAVHINYHYAEDCTVLNLKRKSMGGSPVWFLDMLTQLFTYIVQFAGVFYLFAVFSPLFIALIVLTSAVSVILSFKKQKLDFEFGNARAENDRKLEYLYSTMTDYKYAKEIRVNRAGSFIADKYSKVLKEQMEKLCRYVNVNIGIDVVSAIISVVQSAIMYLYFSYQVYSAQISIAEYTVLISATTLLVSILLEFFKSAANLKKTVSLTGLFREYRNTVKENSSIAASSSLKMPDISKDRMTLSFENVSFSYPNSDRIILKNINLTLNSGERVGLVGLNGSGKTTLIKLICRLYDPVEGVIKLNGIDIRTIPHYEYTKLIGIVLQDFCLFAYPI